MFNYPYSIEVLFEERNPNWNLMFFSVTGDPTKVFWRDDKIPVGFDGFGPFPNVLEALKGWQSIRGLKQLNEVKVELKNNVIPVNFILKKRS